MQSSVIEKLAIAFSDQLKKDLSNAQLYLINRLNLTPAYEGDACASRDFCHADRKMKEAFEEVLGREVNSKNAADRETYKAAWAIAKKNSFYWSNMPRKIQEITLIDPDSNQPVQVCLYKEKEGGIFGIDKISIEKSKEPILSPFGNGQVLLLTDSDTKQ
jgi:hypothetical protein